MKRQLMNYLVGFAVSLLLTVSAYSLVMDGPLYGLVLWVVLGVLAIVQLIVQLYFFLHLGDVEARLQRLAFGFMVVILIIIVGGTLWIMNNLNYNMMYLSPQEKDDYMNLQRDKGF